MLRPQSRQSANYPISPETKFYIDLDGDSAFRNQQEVADDGAEMTSEEYAIDQPFILDGNVFRVAHIDLTGTELFIEDATMEPSPSVGFSAFETEEVVVLAVVREDDLKLISAHLQTYLMEGEFLINAFEACQIYNPGGATPAFFIIDGAGSVQFSSVGAGSTSVLKASLESRQ